MSDGRELQIFRDGRHYPKVALLRLPKGAQGNLTTLAAMARIVREDALSPDLRSFAFDRIIGRDREGQAAQIDAAYGFCRDQVEYLPESDTTETVADLWSCCYGLNADHPAGDCAIKSVALATCLSYLKLRPYFVALKQISGADFFNHVFVRVEVNGSELALDPTPPEFRPGEFLPSFQEMTYRIWQ